MLLKVSYEKVMDSPAFQQAAWYYLLEAADSFLPDDLVERTTGSLAVAGRERTCVENTVGSSEPPRLWYFK